MIDIPPCLPDRVAGPDVVYSSLPGPVIQVDGACFSRPRRMEAIQNEDDILLVDHGTNINDCARVECGPVALYCYESVEAPSTAVVVFQPQHFPSPVIALADNLARCYHNPAFIKTVVENYGTTAAGTNTSYGSYAMPVALSSCGVAYLYESCNGNEEIVVVNENSPTVYYSGQCWTNPQVVTNFGTDTSVVAGTDVVPVSGCSDVLCSGSDTNGATVTYVDRQLGHTVNVEFSHLDIGIPYFGIMPEKLDDGENGLWQGQVTLTFDRNRSSQTIIQSVPASGRLLLHISLAGHPKRLILTRSGIDTVYILTQGQNRMFLNVLAGDRLRLELVIAKANVARFSGRLTGFVRWVSAPLSVRKFDEVQLDYVGTTAVNAVGFCGLAARTPYVFYGTLPAEEETTYPNPDTYLTVQGAYGPEYVLVKSFPSGERLPEGPNGSVQYDGSGLVGPLTFRCYTGRGAAGAHGELDVWLDTPGQFPDALAAGHYSLLIRPDDWYRRTAQVGDTRRSSLIANFTGTPQLPGVYVSSVGDQVVASSTSTLFNSIEINGTVYERSGTAEGLAYRIVALETVYPVLTKENSFTQFFEWTYDTTKVGATLPDRWHAEGSDDQVTWSDFSDVAGTQFQINGHHSYSYWRVVGRSLDGTQSTEYSNVIAD